MQCHCLKKKKKKTKMVIKNKYLTIYNHHILIILMQ